MDPLLDGVRAPFAMPLRDVPVLVIGCITTNWRFSTNRAAFFKEQTNMWVCCELTRRADYC